MAVINLRAEPDPALLYGGEQHPAAAILGEPTGDHPSAGGRVRHRQEQIAAGILVRRRQTRSAQRAEFGGWFIEVKSELGGDNMLQVGLGGPCVVEFGSDEQEGQFRIQL